MTEEDLKRLENKSWIIQVFDPKRLPSVAQKGWQSVHVSTKHNTLHQVEENEADQYELEPALNFAKIFADNVTAEDWKRFDWCVYNFRTFERIPISAL